MRGLDGGVLFSLLFCCHPLGLEPPPRFFPLEKLSRPPLRGTIFSVCFAKQSLKFLPLKGRWIQKRMFLKTEGFFSRSRFCCHPLGLEPPPRFFPWKNSLVPLNEGQLFHFVLLNTLFELPPPFGYSLLSKRESFFSSFFQKFLKNIL